MLHINLGGFILFTRTKYQQHLSLEGIGIKKTEVNYTKVTVLKKLKRQMVDANYIAIIVIGRPAV